MPVKPSRPCLAPACGATSTTGYCDAHARKDARHGSARERGYSSKWEGARAGYIAKHPYCAMCWARGKRAAATVLDHIEPHKGDWSKFWDRTNWQGLCKACHDRKTAGEGSWGTFAVRPPAMSTALIPFVVVCGPPGAGKLSIVNAAKGPDDLVIDIDAIKARLSGEPLFKADHEQWGRAALIERNALLLSLCVPPPRYPRAWLLTGAPKASDRRWWRDTTGARVLLVRTPLERCLDRIARERPVESVAGTSDAARKWWASYSVDTFADEVFTQETTL